MSQNEQVELDERSAENLARRVAERVGKEEKNVNERKLVELANEVLDRLDDERALKDEATQAQEQANTIKELRAALKREHPEQAISQLLQAIHRNQSKEAEQQQ